MPKEKEQRNARAIVSKPGGSAGKNSLTYKVTIPNSWAAALDITKEDRDLIMTFDGKKIVIERKKKEK